MSAGDVISKCLCLLYKRRVDVIRQRETESIQFLCHILYVIIYQRTQYILSDSSHIEIMMLSQRLCTCQDIYQMNIQWRFYQRSVFDKSFRFTFKFRYLILFYLYGYIFTLSFRKTNFRHFSIVCTDRIKKFGSYDTLESPFQHFFGVAAFGSQLYQLVYASYNFSPLLRYNVYFSQFIFQLTDPSFVIRKRFHLFQESGSSRRQNHPFDFFSRLCLGMLYIHIKCCAVQSHDSVLRL